ncbi:MAG: phosphate regulon sensor protein PhoR, partial [Usitatibacteraceae bacterium]
MRSAHKLLLTAALRVALLAALGGLLGGLAFGWTAAFVMTTLIVFAGFSYHAWKLSQLHIWLGSELRAADLPDGFGTWGDVLSDLYRVIRQLRTEQQAL